MRTIIPAYARALRRVLVLASLTLLAAPFAFGWGKDGHMMINYVGAKALPASVPAFMRTPQALAEIRYLGPEPDRWRAEPELNSTQAADHFIDWELAMIAAPNGLPDTRYAFIRNLYAAQIEHPKMAAELTPQKVGMLPWQANEVFERLRLDLHDYRASLATRRNTYDIEQAVLYDIAWLGHYVGDGSEPLHVSVNYNGWVEKSNPHDFSRAPGIHYRFESQFVHDNIQAKDIESLVPATPVVLNSPFRDFVKYLKTTRSYVDEVYQLDKEGAFYGHGTVQSRAFTEARLAAGATMFRNMVYTAWVQSAQPLPQWHAPKSETHAPAAMK